MCSVCTYPQKCLRAAEPEHGEDGEGHTDGGHDVPPLREVVHRGAGGGVGESGEDRGDEGGESAADDAGV